MAVIQAVAQALIDVFALLTTSSITCIARTSPAKTSVTKNDVVTGGVIVAIMISGAALIFVSANDTITPHTGSALTFEATFVVCTGGIRSVVSAVETVIGSFKALVDIFACDTVSRVSI